MYPDLFPRKLFESTIKKNSEFLIGPHEKNGLLPMGILNQNSQNLKQKFVNQTY